MYNPFEPEPREPEPWPDPTVPSHVPWYDGTVLPEVSSSLGSTPWGIDSEFLDSGQRKLYDDHQRALRTKYTRRGFSVGFGSFERKAGG